MSLLMYIIVLLLINLAFYLVVLYSEYLLPKSWKVDKEQEVIFVPLAQGGSIPVGRWARDMLITACLGPDMPSWIRLLYCMLSGLELYDCFVSTHFFPPKEEVDAEVVN